MANNEKLWGYLVLGAAMLLFVVFIFKVLFWAFVGGIFLGSCWIVLNCITGDHEYTPFIVIGVVACGGLSYVSYQIGYGFEQTPAGGQAISTANTILNVETMRATLPAQIEQQASNALANASSQVAFPSK